MLDDVATYVAANSTAHTVGVNLTKGFMPENPGTVTTLFETGGFYPLHYFSTGSQTRGYERPGLMVHSRSTDYQTARTAIDAVFTLLDGITDTGLPTSTGTHYVAIDATQSPFEIGRDRNDRFLLGVNFNVTKTTG